MMIRNRGEPFGVHSSISPNATTPSLLDKMRVEFPKFDIALIIIGLYKLTVSA
jgi:hypothetical protein